MGTKTDIRNLSEEKLNNFLAEKGVKPFRAKQIHQWLWQKQVKDFEDMTNLSKDLRQTLREHFTVYSLGTQSQQKAADGTIKSAFELHDGKSIESVLIPTPNRMTACVSSQVGCSLSCKFCATGYMKRMRNLEAGEIVDQVVEVDRLAQQQYDKGLTNIVFMGMGEPLLNYKNVLKAIDRITDEKGLGMSAKRITVSTAGVAKQIRRLAEDKVRFNLALSLHAADDAKRNEIMAINQSNNLKVLREALIHFYKSTKNQVTLEYIVFQDFNDSLKDAEQLARFALSIPAKVNIIEYNPIEEADFINTSDDKLDQFGAHLGQRGVTVNIRRSRGKDIDAACGQLANKNA